MGGRIIRFDRGEEPEWWEHAVKAAANLETDGNEGGAGVIMRTTYRDIHTSEWAWSNTVPDEVLLNSGTLDQLYGMVELLNNKYKFYEIS